MKLDTLNPLQLLVMERLLTERLDDAPVAECALLSFSVQADLDAVKAERARRQQRRDKRAA